MYTVYTRDKPRWPLDCVVIAHGEVGERDLVSIYVRISNYLNPLSVIVLTSKLYFFFKATMYASHVLLIPL